MKTIYLERSVSGLKPAAPILRGNGEVLTPAAPILRGNGEVLTSAAPILRGNGGSWTEALELEGVERIVVGTGPGSFAGIRAAIAFAQGYRLGTGCEVLGLPSACACAGEGKLAVVGDARRGKIWIALFDGYEMKGEVFQVEEQGLAGAIPGDFGVVTVDEERIGEMLKRVFGERYLGGRKPDGEGLRRFAEANPGMIKPEPLPIYLNPAVR